MSQMPDLWMTPMLANQCRRLVAKTARKYQIPPCFIVAHVRNPLADEARKEVQRFMLVTMQLRRWQVAMIFNRDVRRIRKSVLGA